MADKITEFIDKAFKPLIAFVGKNKLNKENQAMKELIIQLIKENQKIKTENNLLIKNMN